MNLMDMLAGDSPGREPLDVSVEPRLEMNSEQNNVTGVYYLPTQLCQIQIQLLDLVVQMFKGELLLELKNRKKKASIASLLESDTPDLQIYDKIELIFNELMVIDKHPSLLVDHFIPKNLILLETNDRLLSLSGKIQLFNRMIDSLINTGKSYHSLIVAQSVRELELIEGLIIGKDLHYLNKSNSKLYDDNIRNSPNSKVCLYLITTSQLYNNFQGVPELDSIISFDLNLDTTHPSIKFLRRNKVPILIPIPYYSIEHILLQKKPPPSAIDPLHQYRLSVIHTLIMNRDKLSNEIPDFFVSTYGPSMEKFINWTNNDELSLNYDDLNTCLNFDFTSEDVIKQIKLFYNQDVIKLEKYDYESYKSTLAEVLNYKLREIKTSIAEITEVKLPKVRIKNTKIQCQFDDNEDVIAQNFKNLKRLKEDAIISERKLAKTENYLIQYSNNNKQLEKKLDLLKLVKLSGKFDIKEQKEILGNLKEKYSEMNNEFDQLNHQYEESKVNYQTSSSEAVQLSNKVQQLRSKNDKLEKHFNGVGMKLLPQLVRKDVGSMYQERIDKIKSENEFLVSFFNDRIDKVVNERHGIIDTTSGGSSSRSSNRMSRASTPF